MDSLVKNIDSPSCWLALQRELNSALVDVRSAEEIATEGFIDLSSIGKSVKIITWTGNSEDFLEDFSRNFFGFSDKIFFICKSGVRSLKAAELVSCRNYHNCYNVFDGFIGVKSYYNNNLEEKSEFLPWRYQNEY